MDGRQHARRLLAAHDRDARIGPSEQKTWAISPSAHAVIARAKATADQDGDFGHARGGNRSDELCAMLGDALRLIFSADHEAADILQEQQRDPSLTGKLDEMRAFDRAFRKQYAVIGEDRDGHAPDMRKAADQGRAIQRLELMKFAAVDQPRDDFVHVIRRAHVIGDNAVKFFGVVFGETWFH